MWPIVAGFTFGGVCLMMFACFILWAAREHHFANKYREVLEAYNSMPTQASVPGWQVEYKDNQGKKQSILIPGNMPESEMLQEMKKRGCPVNKILSSRRV